MDFKDYADFRQALLRGETHCISAVEHFLHVIELHKDLNAFIDVWADEARECAKQIDQKIADGNAGKLAGMVIALKDNICYKNHPVSASSAILKGFISLYSSTVVERLLAEDAIIIGRTNCDEFAMGASNETSIYGCVKNNLDKERVPGGSSGGSAVAVSAKMCHAALGSDTGGSIRQPAAFCGIYGMKPTYGMVSRWGLLSYASSFDQIGPLTRSIRDMSLILSVISGPDEFDTTLIQNTPPDFQISINSKPKRIAVLDACIEDPGLDPEIRKGTLDIMSKLTSLGHYVEKVNFPFLPYLVPTYYVLTTAEASSNLSRYQGLQLGHRTSEKGDLDALFKQSRTEGFGAEVKRRIMLGTFVLSSGYYDAYYKKGQKVRQLIRQKSLEILNQFDFMMTPTTPTPAFRFGEKSKDPVSMYLADIYTVQAPIAGLPAISIPAGLHSNGMPWGIQLMGRPCQDHAMLSFSNTISEITATSISETC